MRTKSVDPPPLLTFSRLIGTFVDGNEVVMHHKIDPSTLEFAFYSLLGNEITRKDLGFKGNQCRSLAFTLEYLSRYTVCCGLPADNHNQAVVGTQIDNLCKKVKIGSRAAFVSRKCQHMVSTQGETCLECSHLKAQLLRRKVNYKNIMQTKNCLLSESEKQLNMNEVLKDIRNALQ